MWLGPAAWLVLSPPFSEPQRIQPRTRHSLKLLGDVLHTYIDRFRVAPPDLATLRAFAVSEGRPFTAYDASGQRFDYLRLDEIHFLLRSFGADGDQNRDDTERDPGIISWGPRPAKNLTYAYTEPGGVHLFPAALLAGADSPDGAWHAKLFVDSGRGVRNLLVRHATQTGLYMVARHDAVEEFLWLPGGSRLVFTASGSDRHRDGLYLWDLATDKLTNLTEISGDARIAGPSSKGVTFWLALGGVARVDGGAIVYSFSKLRTGASSIDASRFFGGEHVRATFVGDGPNDLRPDEPPVILGSLIDRPLSLTAHIGGAGGLTVQRAWMSLPLAGDMEKVLLQWHTYSERETQGPLFPYTLWILSAIYGESFAATVEIDARDADVLRTFGTEISRALLNYAIAPTYIRALANETYQGLMDGRPPLSRMADLKASGLSADLPRN